MPLPGREVDAGISLDLAGTWDSQTEVVEAIVPCCISPAWERVGGGKSHRVMRGEHSHRMVPGEHSHREGDSGGEEQGGGAPGEGCYETAQGGEAHVARAGMGEHVALAPTPGGNHDSLPTETPPGAHGHAPPLKRQKQQQPEAGAAAQARATQPEAPRPHTLEPALDIPAAAASGGRRRTMEAREGSVHYTPKGDAAGGVESDSADEQQRSVYVLPGGIASRGSTPGVGVVVGPHLPLPPLRYFLRSRWEIRDAYVPQA